MPTPIWLLLIFSCFHMLKITCIRTSALIEHCWRQEPPVAIWSVDSETLENAWNNARSDSALLSDRIGVILDPCTIDVNFEKYCVAWKISSLKIVTAFLFIFFKFVWISWDFLFTVNREVVPAFHCFWP